MQGWYDDYFIDECGDILQENIMDPEACHQNCTSGCEDSYVDENGFCFHYFPVSKDQVHCRFGLDGFIRTHQFMKSLRLEPKVLSTNIFRNQRKIVLTTKN